MFYEYYYVIVAAILVNIFLWTKWGQEFGFLPEIYAIVIHFLFCSICTSIPALFTVIILQFIGYLGCLKQIKARKGNFPKPLLQFIYGICYIIAITCSYGYYYCETDVIIFKCSVKFDKEIPILTNLINGIITGLHIFYYSLDYYFHFDESFPQKIQFLTGILLSGLILEQIFETARKQMS